MDSPASLNFLGHYFDAERDSGDAFARWQNQELGFVSLNGPYLCQFLEERGLSTALVPLFLPEDERFLELLRNKPKTVVISTTFLPFAEGIDKMAAFVRQHAPDTHIIAGGTQVWKSYQHLELVDEGQITDDILPTVAEHNYFIDAERLHRSIPSSSATGVKRPWRRFCDGSVMVRTITT